VGDIEITRDGRLRLTLDSGKVVLITSQSILALSPIAFPEPRTELKLMSGTKVLVQESLEDILAACADADGGA
jgi:hypothetical protein